MTVVNEKFTVNTQGFTDIIDITQKVKHAVYKYSLQNAQVNVYVAGSTVSITNIEYEPGLLVDLPQALEKIAPVEADYHHDDTWHDGNGYAHNPAHQTVYEHDRVAFAARTGPVCGRCRKHTQAHGQCECQQQTQKSFVSSCHLLTS